MAVDEWDYREVCPDGNCVGVIGSDGRCKVCGHVLPNWDNERERGQVVDDEEAEAAPEPHREADEGGEGGGAELAPDVSDDEHEWSRRKLCPDGACVGVIGADHVCTVCGKTAA